MKHCLSSSSFPCFLGAPGIGWRHGISVLASFGFFCAMSQRVAFNIALVAMVNNSNSDAHFGNSSVSDECPPPQILINSTAPVQVVALEDIVSYLISEEV